VCDRKKDGAAEPSRFLLRRLYAARGKAQDTAQIEKTEKAAEKLKNFSKKGLQFHTLPVIIILA